MCFSGNARNAYAGVHISRLNHNYHSRQICNKTAYDLLQHWALTEDWPIRNWAAACCPIAATRTRQLASDC